MKRILILLFLLPSCLYSFDSNNFKVYTKIGYSTTLSSEFFDNGRFSLYSLRAKYSDNIANDLRIVTQCEFTQFEGDTLFPYVKYTDFRFHLLDAVFLYNANILDMSFGRFIPSFSYSLPRSVVNSPMMHYPIFNNYFLNNRINGMEVGFDVPFGNNSFRINAIVGENQSKFKLFSSALNVNEIFKISAYGGNKDTIWNISSDGYNVFGGFTFINLYFLDFLFEIQYNSLTNGSFISYNLSGNINFSGFNASIIYDQYDIKKLIGFSMNYWIIEKRFDISSKYELDLNSKDSRYYIVLEGII
jgi:hypothetical protein